MCFALPLLWFGVPKDQDCDGFVNRLTQSHWAIEPHEHFWGWEEPAVPSNFLLSGWWKDRALLACRVCFCMATVVVAGLFGNSPVSGLWEPLSWGLWELGGGPKDWGSSKYCFKLMDAMSGRGGTGIFHTWKTSSGAKMKLFYISAIRGRGAKTMFEDVSTSKSLVTVLAGYTNKWSMHRETRPPRCLPKTTYVSNRLIRCEGNGYLDKVKGTCAIIL